MSDPGERPSDQESLDSWRRRPRARTLRRLIDRYLPFVYSSAFRRTGDATRASDVTRAVFLVLARRARKLRTKTVLAGWLFEVTAVACRKLNRRREANSGSPSPGSEGGISAHSPGGEGLCPSGRTEGGLSARTRRRSFG